MNNRVFQISSALLFVSLLGVASPSLTAMLDAVKVSSASHGFMSDLRYAHSEAARRDSRVTLCKSSDGSSCAAAGDWSQGWIVFQDTNANGLRDAGEDLILREQRFSASLRVMGTLNAVRSVSFTPIGTTKLFGAAIQSGTFTVCHASHQPVEARQVTLTSAGGLQLKRQLVDRCA